MSVKICDPLTGEVDAVVEAKVKYHHAYPTHARMEYVTLEYPNGRVDQRVWIAKESEAFAEVIAAE